ncbi:hypothetical protein Nwi_2056 [Nitrobacter winogradskyi Nb-255]|uniref:Uncharacterized protein n=1 Tax=Nitrobacter winogradskyi (strain ATCC 25391 / DSM 10237 / CIP 104748 / NCIMB 11846 / Nb-255) TaxID=323098 RepID=Q3SQX7_NITWN|nr:hypothetical protein Nwi_2056 [Nitrobacter winogradskyi Nb-255]
MNFRVSDGGNDHYSRLTAGARRFCSLSGPLFTAHIRRSRIPQPAPRTAPRRQPDRFYLPWCGHALYSRRCPRGCPRILAKNCAIPKNRSLFASVVSNASLFKRASARSQLRIPGPEARSLKLPRTTTVDGLCTSLRGIVSNQPKKELWVTCKLTLLRHGEGKPPAKLMPRTHSQRDHFRWRASPALKRTIARCGWRVPKHPVSHLLRGSRKAPGSVWLGPRASC